MSRKRNSLVNTELNLEIQSLSHDGRGIARFDEKVCFVFGALPGESVKARVTRSHSRYLEATTTELVTSSAERVNPICDFFGLCGGCQLQHLQKPLQIEYKTQFLKDLLKNAKVEAKQFAPPLQGQDKGYRQKARLGVRYLESKDELLIGFREQSANKIARIESCKILNQRVGDNLDKLKALLLQLSIKKHIPQIEVSIGDKIVALVFRHLEPCPPEDVALLQRFGKENDYAIYLQPQGHDSVHKIEDANTPFHLSYALTDQNLQFDFHPLDFIQVNPHMNQQMINQALEWLSPQNDETLLDLFCGLGNFSLPFSRMLAKVIGVEGSQTMVQRAAENAALNEIKNASFHAFDLTKPCQKEEWASLKVDKILLDPPRSGAKEIIVQLKQFEAKEILYISCNPATFARDADILVNQLGYHLIKVGLMDMFPHTAHVEVMGLFSKLKKARSLPKADDFSARRQAPEAPGTYALVRDWAERAQATTLKIHMGRV